MASPAALETSPKVLLQQRFATKEKWEPCISYMTMAAVVKLTNFCFDTTIQEITKKLQDISLTLPTEKKPNRKCYQISFLNIQHNSQEMIARALSDTSETAMREEIKWLVDEGSSPEKDQIKYLIESRTGKLAVKELKSRFSDLSKSPQFENFNFRIYWVSNREEQHDFSSQHDRSIMVEFWLDRNVVIRDMSLREQLTAPVALSPSERMKSKQETRARWDQEFNQSQANQVIILSQSILNGQALDLFHKAFENPYTTEPSEHEKLDLEFAFTFVGDKSIRNWAPEIENLKPYKEWFTQMFSSHPTSQTLILDHTYFEPLLAKIAILVRDKLLNDLRHLATLKAYKELKSEVTWIQKSPSSSKSYINIKLWATKATE
jgi:hypothetical protein